MQCPRCSKPTAEGAACCQHCGLHLSVLSELLGSNLAGLNALTDTAHCLRRQEKDFLHHRLENFQRQFPQVFFAVYLGVLPGSPTPPELAFWLLNHAAFQPPDPGRLNEHAALLIIDPVTKQAGLTVGYALDRHLPHKKLLAILRRIRTPLWHGEFAEAIDLAVQLLTKSLRRAGHRRPRHHEFPAPEVGADFFSTSGLDSLRPAEAERERRSRGPLSGSPQDLPPGSV